MSSGRLYNLQQNYCCVAVAVARSAVVATLATAAAAAAALRHVVVIIAERDALAAVAYWPGPAPFFVATAAIVAHHQCHNIFTTKHSHANRVKKKKNQNI